jgi:hypothetical protein
MILEKDAGSQRRLLGPKKRLDHREECWILEKASGPEERD